MSESREEDGAGHAQGSSSAYSWQKGAPIEVGNQTGKLRKHDPFVQEEGVWKKCGATRPCGGGV